MSQKLKSFLSVPVRTRTCLANRHGPASRRIFHRVEVGRACRTWQPSPDSQSGTQQRETAARATHCVTPINSRLKARPPASETPALRPPTARVAARALDLLPHRPSLTRAETYVLAGEYDKAVDEIAHALDGEDHVRGLLPSPVFFDVALLHVDPLWAPLRDHPRFQELVGEGDVGR